ncbi:MAG: proteasome activator [Actinomycetota bacterium]
MQQDEPQDPSVVVVRSGAPAPDDEEQSGEAVHHPAKVMRIASMARQLLEEVRQAQLDEASRTRMGDIYETSIKELSEVLSPDLQDELERLSSPFEQEAPSEAELRVAHAQLVGWLEGLFHGIQAMLFAQQMENRQRLDEMRRPGLPARSGEVEGSRPGTYL